MTSAGAWRDQWWPSDFKVMSIQKKPATAATAMIANKIHPAVVKVLRSTSR
jgi:hypothetical protein